MSTHLLPDGWTIKRVGSMIARFDAGVSVNGDDRPAIGDESGVLKISAVTEGRFQPSENKMIEGLERARKH